MDVRMDEELQSMETAEVFPLERRSSSDSRVRIITPNGFGRYQHSRWKRALKILGGVGLVLLLVAGWVSQFGLSVSINNKVNNILSHNKHSLPDPHKRHHHNADTQALHAQVRSTTSPLTRSQDVGSMSTTTRVLTSTDPSTIKSLTSRYRSTLTSRRTWIALLTTRLTTTSSTSRPPLSTPSEYCVEGTCYRFRSDQFSCASCLAIDGTHIRGYCYYNAHNCSGYTVDDHCFTSRRPAADRHCPQGGYYGPDDFCYYSDVPDCDGGHFIECTCFINFSRTISYQSCRNIEGVYYRGTRDSSDGRYDNYIEGTCYFNSFNCTGFELNGQCYTNRSTGVTPQSCLNLDGVITEGYCYHQRPTCPDYMYLIDGECFRSSYSSPSRTTIYRRSGQECSTCVNKGGHYRNGKCYSYQKSIFLAICPYFEYMDLCETNRSNMSPSECLQIGGFPSTRYHASTACYFTPSGCSTNHTYECRCYEFKSRYYQKECADIGGDYDATSWLCYHNSTVCPYYKHDEVCYRSRTTRRNASLCTGVYDSFYAQCYSDPT